MQVKPIRYHSYKLTGDHGLLNDENHITPEIKRILQRLHPQVLDGKKGMIEELTEWAERYPKVPTFKNYLTLVHNLNGDKEKAYRANRWLMKEHPDYLFGKLNLAAEYLEKKTPERIPEIFGEIMDLNEVYPEREVFHLEEFIAFNAIASRYYILVGNMLEADKHLKMMQDVEPENPKTKGVEEHLRFSLAEKITERHQKEEEFRKSVDVEDLRSAIQTDRPPKFNYPEQMQWLYDGDLDIDIEKIKSILKLEREPLVKDLCALLRDSIVRFDHYFFDDESESDPFCFPIHALVLLAELKADNATEPILEILRQDEEYMDFWFGDIMQEVAVPAIVFCGGNRLDQLLAYMKEPNRYTYTKCQVSEAVIKMGRAYSDRRDEVLEWAGKVLDFHAEKWNDERYADSDFIGLFVADLVDAKMHELLPGIKELYEREIVAYGICGDYRSVEKDIYKGVEYGLEMLDWNMEERYKKLASYLNHDDGLPEKIFDDFGFDNGQDGYLTEQRPIVKLKKVGRNEPCSCGSGKKYKKCCIDLG